MIVKIMLFANKKPNLFAIKMNFVHKLAMIKFTKIVVQNKINKKSNAWSPSIFCRLII